MRLTVKNWASFQHYKDRSPKWIKLHKSTLDDYDFQRLPVASRALAPMLWLLASEYQNGIITASIQEIAFRLRTSEEEVNTALTPLVDAHFFSLEQDASNSLAEPERDASPEKRREEESRRDDIPEGSDELIGKIAKAYPKLSHLAETEIPRNVVEKIIDGVAKDGGEKVLLAVQAYAAQLDNSKFAAKPLEFFSEFQYRPFMPESATPKKWRVIGRG